MPINPYPQSIVVSTTPKYAIDSPKISRMLIPRLQLLQYALNIQREIANCNDVMLSKNTRGLASPIMFLGWI